HASAAPGAARPPGLGLGCGRPCLVPERPARDRRRLDRRERPGLAQRRPRPRGRHLRQERLPALRRAGRAAAPELRRLGPRHLPRAPVVLLAAYGPPRHLVHSELVGRGLLLPVRSADDPGEPLLPVAGGQRPPLPPPQPAERALALVGHRAVSPVTGAGAVSGAS